MAHPFLFNEAQFNRLFPFYLLISRELQIEAVGRSAEKLFGTVKNGSFNDHFAIPRPYTPVNTLNDLVQLQNQLVVLEPVNKQGALMRGQFEYLDETGQVLFVGSPWFGSMEQVLDSQLVIDDFARHDPLIDLLHVMKSQEIATTDLKQLVNTINKQKNELKKASKEGHDLALFTTQNPDPIIRINFEGDVLKNNPAAARLDFFEYDKEWLRNDIFFKRIADRIKETPGRCTIEARSGNTDYSFVCIPIPEEDYINIYGRDITQQKANQEQMERLSLVASANENGVVFTHADGKIFWCNEGVEKITGYTRQEIIGKTPIELLKGPLTNREVIKSMTEDFYHKRTFSNELIQYRKDGSWYWGKTKGQPVRNKEGRISYFAIIEDITAAKESEEQLRVLSSIAEENTHGVVIADEQGRVEWVNKSFEKITGYSLQEMIGKKPGHVLQGPLTSAETIAYVKTQIYKGEPFVCEILNYHKNGNTYWLRLQGQALKDRDGKVTKYFAIEEDITQEKLMNQQLKEFESKFKLALEKIGDNVWEHDFRTGITRFSKEKNSLLGLENVVGPNMEQAWWNSIHEADMPMLTENDLRYRNGEIDHHILEYRVVQPGGTIRWVLDRGVVLEKDNNNKPLLIIGTHTDITKAKTIEQELLVAKNLAETSKKAKEMFLANMSHEIRTPMNAILGMGNQLKKSALNEKQRFQLDTINAAAENLLVIINDILDLSKIEAGKLTVEQIGFEPKKVVGKAMQVLMHKAEEKGLSLVNSYCDSRLSDVLIGDPYRLNQVLLNLISNAVKFTEQGTIDVTCRVINDTPEMQWIEAAVSDTGIGMEEEYVNRLFDNFSQEYESTSRKYGGTGLGMSICKELIQLMGGKISVTSKKGVGTTVSFQVPFQKGTIADIPVQKEEQIDQDFLQGKNILITDDNEMNRLVAATLLQQYGAAVHEARNGEEAVTAVASQEIHLVLMDIQMPVLNGYDATKFLRRKGITIPVLALTANAVKGEKEKCLEAGMNDYISKPFREEVFLKKIAHWLNMNATEPGTPAAQEEQQEPLFDLATLKEIGKDNTVFIHKMLRLFCDQAPETIRQIKTAFANGELEKMGALAHKLKPGLDNLKVTSLRQVIREIEKAGKANTVTEQLPEQISITESTIDRVVQQLQQILSQ
ncbi:MAG: PAS domain S-box protein [Dinghuibacter sp.]|nr:PAS domain S-box protein [Dinghuibacter sp.]